MLYSGGLKIGKRAIKVHAQEGSIYKEALPQMVRLF